MLGKAIEADTCEPGDRPEGKLKALRRATDGCRATFCHRGAFSPTQSLPSTAGERSESAMSKNYVFAFSTLVIGGSVALGAHAQEAVPQPTIEVTASRVAETADASLADVSIITRADI